MIVRAPLSAAHDPCDSYGNCVSSTVTYIRANPDHTLYLGDSFSVSLSVTTGQNTSGYSVSWTYDSSVFDRSGDTFTVAGNETGTFSIEASVAFGNSSLTTSQSVTVVPLIISLHTELVNVTDAHGLVERNLDGSFYRNDSFCDSWSATFRFAAERTDIRINVTSDTPLLYVFNYTSGPLGKSGQFCYVVETSSAFRPYNATLVARAINWQGVSMALKETSQAYAVVRYDPQFTTYAYMEYRNSTEPSSLERPWVLFVRYDGNLPGYSYSGDSNTLAFNGSETMAERAYFDNFTFTTLSYRPFTSGGVFMFHVANSTGSVKYSWVNRNSSAPFQGGTRIQKYVFEVEPSTLSPLLAKGFSYQNVTMTARWAHEETYSMESNYWLVPFLWTGRLNVVSVGSDGNILPTTPISITIQNPSPLDQQLTSNFKQVFGNDPEALRAFQEDLYETNETMTFRGEGSLSIQLNQTSLVPPLITVTAGEVTISGNFTFAPAFVNTTIESVPNSLNGTIYYANATVPLWSYNMIEGSLSFLPVSATISSPTSFLELVNSSGWIAGNTTAPQTPSAFASQQYGFWPMGQNLTVYANLQGGGVNFLGAQTVGPGDYQALLNVEPWSGGVSNVQLVEGGYVIENESTLNASAYPSPLPQGITGLYAVSYPATGQDVKAVFTNVWGAETTIDLGTATLPPPLTNLIPETTVTAFGIAGIAWLIVSGLLSTKRKPTHG
jgi:hypothetical protein